MKSSRLMRIIILSFLVIGMGCGGDDDKASNPVNTVPASLVNTWWYNSGTQDGVPISSFAEVSFTDTSEAGSLTINSNATWSGTETYNSQVVFTQSGTLVVKGDTLKITRTTMDGSPAPAHDTSSSLWNVTADTLRVTNELDLGDDTIIVIVKYIEE